MSVQLGTRRAAGLGMSVQLGNRRAVGYKHEEEYQKVGMYE
jgi:hypothetical protein